MAMFDFDWTLVKPKSGGTFPKDSEDWQWLRPTVPEIVRGYYQRGFQIVVFTNQSKAWKQDQIVAALTALDIPCSVGIAFDRKEYKPSRVMFDTIVGANEADHSASFFVGDALGRAADFADSDKKFAEAIGVRFFAPEDIFPFEASDGKMDGKMDEPPRPSADQEVVVMVGYPGSGKSTVARDIFGSAGSYEVIDSDVYRSSITKMVAAGKKAMTRGKSVVFDATNPTKERRALFIEIAKEFGVPARCVHVNTSMEEAVARNNARTKGVPKIAYYTYRKRFEEPNVSDGFLSVVTV